MSVGRDELRTVILGRYEDFEADIVVDILTEAGIVAFHRHPPEESDHFMYNRDIESDRGIIMVDAARADEARRLVAEELPKHIASIEEAMDALDVNEPGAPDA